MDITGNDAFSENEIIEEYNEEAEAEWRKKHQESVKKQKLKESQQRFNEEQNKSVDEIFDQYELLEEMASELAHLEDSGQESNEMISKLLSGDIKISKPKERKSHADKKMISVEKPVEMKEKIQKRKVRFSNSLENVKIFDSVPDFQCKRASTIQITFKHSSTVFQQPAYDGDEDIAYRNPSEIYSKFIEVTTTPKTKSILKETDYSYDKSVNAKYKFHEHVEREDYIESLPLSCFPIVMNESVVERQGPQKVDEIKDLSEKPKRVSKFKEMRSSQIKS